MSSKTRIGRKFHFSDPRLETELASLFQVFQGGIVSANLDIGEISDAVGGAIKFSRLAALKEFIEGTKDGRYLRIVSPTDTVLLYLGTSGSGSTNMISTSVAGCCLTKGGVWTDACCAKGKHFLPLFWSGAELENKLAQLRIRKYRYKHAKKEIHLGPTAEQFRKLFGVCGGAGLAAMDVASAAVLGVQSLVKKVSILEAKVKKLEAKKWPQLLARSR